MDDAGNAYHLARSGGKHHGWYLLQRRLPADSVHRAIASFRQRIIEHEAMILDPTARYSDFAHWDQRRRRNLVEHHLAGGYPPAPGVHRNSRRSIE